MGGTTGSKVVQVPLYCPQLQLLYSVTRTRKVTRPRNLSRSSLFLRLEPSTLHSTISSEL